MVGSRRLETDPRVRKLRGDAGVPRGDRDAGSSWTRRRAPQRRDDGRADRGAAAGPPPHQGAQSASSRGCSSTRGRWRHDGDGRRGGRDGRGRRARRLVASEVVSPVAIAGSRRRRAPRGSAWPWTPEVLRRWDARRSRRARSWAYSSTWTSPRPRRRAEHRGGAAAGRASGGDRRCRLRRADGLRGSLRERAGRGPARGRGQRAMARLAEVADACRGAGLDVGMVSAGATERSRSPAPRRRHRGAGRLLRADGPLPRAARRRVRLRAHRDGDRDRAPGDCWCSTPGARRWTRACAARAAGPARHPRVRPRGARWLPLRGRGPGRHRRPRAYRPGLRAHHGQPVRRLPRRRGRPRGRRVAGAGAPRGP